MVPLKEKNCPSCKNTITNRDLKPGEQYQIPINEEESRIFVDLHCKYCNVNIHPKQPTTTIISIAIWTD